MSGPRVIYFMYHHQKHCSIRATPPKPPKSPDSFILFPLLPPELRLKIWEAIVTEPRTVELSCTPTASHMPKGRWFSHSTPPILFSICSESRDVALMQYAVLDFSPEQIGISWPKLYINFAIDTLWLCADLHGMWAMDLLETNKQLKESLRSLAANEGMWKSLNPLSLTPGFAMIEVEQESPERHVTGVRAGLKALEDVMFHS